ncbi:hypothetical protein [Pantoea stewartii]|uniref:hypothetical protein n=1 Tax=Pantoea stewartii TaxID=66269 RepID=UPI00259FFD96|nr:hypothetical protein [Pantoea stewartii]
MTAINNATNNIVRMVAKNTTIPSLVAEQMSTKFIATIASVRNTPSSPNRHGNTFSRSNRQLDGHTGPGRLKIFTPLQHNKSTAAKTPLYNPLNRHGNTFQGVIASSTGTQPGASKNIHSTAAQQITAAKTPLYHPLNRPGNTFQGNRQLDGHTARAIKNIHSTAAQQITAAKTPLYNPPATVTATLFREQSPARRAHSPGRLKIFLHCSTTNHSSKNTALQPT